MTDFDWLSWQQRPIIFFKAIAVYSGERCGHLSLVYIFHHNISNLDFIGHLRLPDTKGDFRPTLFVFLAISKTFW